MGKRVITVSDWGLTRLILAERSPNIECSNICMQSTVALLSGGSEWQR